MVKLRCMFNYNRMKWSNMGWVLPKIKRCTEDAVCCKYYTHLPSRDINSRTMNEQGLIVHHGGYSLRCKRHSNKHYDENIPLEVYVKMAVYNEG